MKIVDTLVEDIYATLKNGAECTVELKEYFSKQCVNILERALSKHERSAALRMSSIGKKRRQLWYDLKGYEGEELEGNTLLKFLYGDIIESLVKTLAIASGHSVTLDQHQVEVDGVKGSIDPLLDGKMYDIKSCSSYAFKDKFTPEANLGDDAFGYYGQGGGYQEGMRQQGYDIDFEGWLAIDKQNGSMRLSKADKSKVPQAQELIASHREALKSDAPPEKCYDEVPFQKGGNMQLQIGCQYCSFKHECWKDANDGKGLRTFLYSSKPVFLTKVVKEPKVFEV